MTLIYASIAIIFLLLIILILEDKKIRKEIKKEHTNIWDNINQNMKHIGQLNRLVESLQYPPKFKKNDRVILLNTPQLLENQIDWVVFDTTFLQQPNNYWYNHYRDYSNRNYEWVYTIHDCLTNEIMHNIPEHRLLPKPTETQPEIKKVIL